MKTFFSLVTTLSLLLGQLNAPANVPLAQETDTTETATPAETQSPTATATPSQTATEDVKQTPTPQPTATLPAETPSPEVTFTPETSPVEKETSLLSLRADPDYVIAGAGLIVYWEVREDALKEETELQITLPEGLSLEEQGELKFDETSRIVFIPLDSQSGELHLLAGDVSADVVLYAALAVTDSGEIQSETKLFLPLKEKFILDEQGGVLVADEGRVEIKFPENALIETSSITIGKPSGDSVPPFSLSGDPFEITARGEASKEEQTQFSEEITIRVSYADWGVPEEVEGDLTLYWYNPDIKDWEALPTTVDIDTKTIEAFTDHFTVFDFDVNN